MHGTDDKWYKISVGNPEEKKPHGRFRRVSKDNTEVDFKEMGVSVYRLHTSGSGQDKVMDFCQHDNKI